MDIGLQIVTLFISIPAALHFSIQVYKHCRSKPTNINNSIDVKGHKFENDTTLSSISQKTPTSKEKSTLGIMSIVALCISIPAALYYSIQVYKHFTSEPTKIEMKKEMKDHELDDDTTLRAKTYISPIPKEKSTIERVLVLPFDFSSVSEYYRNTALTNLAYFGLSEFQQVLTDRKLYKVVDREILSHLIKEIKFSKTGVVNPKMALTFGQMNGATILLYGKINELISSHELFKDYGININTRRVSVGITITLIDIETSEIIFSKTETTTGKERINVEENIQQNDFSLFRKCITRLIHKMGEQLSQSLHKSSSN